MNSKRSDTKGTRYINIRYFYVIDKVQSWDAVIVYHLTKEKVTNYLTNKSLNGMPFRTFHNSIIGLEELYIGRYKAKCENAKQVYQI